MEIKYDQNNMPKIGGWLYLIAVSLFFSFLGSILACVNDLNIYFTTDTDILKIENITLFKNLFLVKIFLLVIIGTLSLCCITEFLKKKIVFKKHYLILVFLSLIHRIYMLWFLHIFIPIAGLSEGIAGILGALTYLIIIYFYFKKSTRVQKTFIYR